MRPVETRRGQAKPVCDSINALITPARCTPFRAFLLLIFRFPRNSKTPTSFLSIKGARITVGVSPDLSTRGGKKYSSYSTVDRFEVET